MASKNDQLKVAANLKENTLHLQPTWNAYILYIGIIIRALIQYFQVM